MCHRRVLAYQKDNTQLGMKVLLVLLSLTAGLSEALNCHLCDDVSVLVLGLSYEDNICIFQDKNCTYVKECKTACIVSTDFFSARGKYIRDCADDGWDAVPASFLDDHDKKCNGPVWEQVCYCNYDACNENMENQTNTPTRLGETLKCSYCVSVRSHL